MAGLRVGVAGLCDVDAGHPNGKRTADQPDLLPFGKSAPYPVTDVTGREGGQDFTETPFADDPLECWEKGVPLVQAGFTTRQTAERRRMDELVEAIVCHKVWNLAA